VQAVIKIDECVSGPDPGLKFVTSYNIAGTFQQDLEYSEGLASQAQPYAVLAEVRRHEHPTHNRRTAACRQLEAGWPSVDSQRLAKAYHSCSAAK